MDIGFYAFKKSTLFSLEQKSFPFAKYTNTDAREMFELVKKGALYRAPLG